VQRGLVTRNVKKLVSLPDPHGTGVFLVASLNIGGAAGFMTISADTGTTHVPVQLLVCEFDPTIGNCLAIPSPSVPRFINVGDTSFYAIFAVGQGSAILLDPAVNQIFLRFRDASGAIRGSTSGVPVRTQ